MSNPRLASAQINAPGVGHQSYKRVDGGFPNLAPICGGI
jgi:hypothetical protein